MIKAQLEQQYRDVCPYGRETTLESFWRNPLWMSCFKGPVKLEFEFHMPIPKKTSKKKRVELLGEPHIKRPDLDNCIKFYCDVCSVLLYYDDSQVYNISATKQYSNEPKTVIHVTWE